jgi:hypothetical protein
MDLERIAYELQRYLRRKAPYDTGNLHNSIEPVQVSNNEWQVTIGGEPAPYAVYTNEPWISPRWKGKQNPNEGWIDRALDDFVISLASRLGGHITFEKAPKEESNDD